jgi:two-component system NtrC family sensor kinase
VAQAGTRRGDIKEVRLEREIQLALELCAHRLKDVQVDVQVPKDLSVRVSPDEFNQVMMNLVDNAATAMGGDGRLKLSVWRDGTDAVIEVEDDGPGIPDEQLDRIFEPFFSTKVPGQGSGIGLSVARGIIEGYAGTLKAESNDERGSRFVIRLPKEVVCETTAQDTGG